jgi:hypothetical protein
MTAIVLSIIGIRELLVALVKNTRAVLTAASDWPSIVSFRLREVCIIRARS